VRRSDKSKHVPTRPRGQHRGTIGARFSGEDARNLTLTEAIKLANSGQKLSSIGHLNRLALNIRAAQRFVNPQQDANPRDDR
jgi:hypothetical protein